MNARRHEYTLYWGDLHRHTGFSVCRTTDDGCIVEHSRHAYAAAGLDYLATTDHTDVEPVKGENRYYVRVEGSCSLPDRRTTGRSIPSNRRSCRVLPAPR